MDVLLEFIYKLTISMNRDIYLKTIAVYPIHIYVTVLSEIYCDIVPMGLL